MSDKRPYVFYNRLRLDVRKLIHRVLAEHYEEYEEDFASLGIRGVAKDREALSHKSGLSLYIDVDVTAERLS